MSILNKIKKYLSDSFKISGLPIIFGLLGSAGGQGLKWLRRFIFPAIITLYSLYIIRNLWCLTIYLMSFILTIGYGIPDSTDEGSALGRIYYKLFHANTILANIFTRGTVGILICISMLSVPILTGRWLMYILGSLIIISSYALLSWQDFGEVPITIFKKEYKLLKVDIVHYSIVGFGLIKMIG